tara:strand:- start:1209 stop:1328 length:120 start_codon:yes stop_codon:yes gene_type:complete
MNEEYKSKLMYHATTLVEAKVISKKQFKRIVEKIIDLYK